MKPLNTLSKSEGYRNLAGCLLYIEYKRSAMQLADGKLRLCNGKRNDRVAHRTEARLGTCTIVRGVLISCELHPLEHDRKKQNEGH